MSKFSNPAGQPPDAVARYVRDLLELVGERDPLAVQRELLPALENLCAGLGPAQLRQPEAPGKWSILGVLEHLVDQELVNAYRYRATLAEDEPPLGGYDQDRWSARLHYGRAEASTLLAELRVLRERNLRLFADLDAAELARVGLHAEDGRLSLARMAALTAGHDLVHRRQITRIRAALDL